MEKILLTELPRLAREVLGRLVPAVGRATLVVLQGNLGAGKTTFVQTLGKELGITDVMQSPTYVLMKSYPVTWHDFKTLVHIDAYRLDIPEEFIALKPETFLHDPQTLLVVEWPERAGDRLPKADMTISFSSEGAKENERFIDVTP